MTHSTQRMGLAWSCKGPKCQAHSRTKAAQKPRKYVPGYDYVSICVPPSFFAGLAPCACVAARRRTRDSVMSDAVTSPAVGIAGHGGMPGMPVLPPAPRYQVRKCTNISAAFGMFFPTAPGTGGGGWRYRRRQHRCPLEEEWRQDRVVSGVDGGRVRCAASETQAYRRQGCTLNTSFPSTPAPYSSPLLTPPSFSESVYW